MTCRVQSTPDLPDLDDILALEIAATRLRSIEFVGMIERQRMGEMLAAVAGRMRKEREDP